MQMDGTRRRRYISILVEVISLPQIMPTKKTRTDLPSPFAGYGKNGEKHSTLGGCEHFKAVHSTVVGYLMRY
jgi:hypothetical protein